MSTQDNNKKTKKDNNQKPKPVGKPQNLNSTTPGLFEYHKKTNN